jgi:hypothetical protein
MAFLKADWQYALITDAATRMVDTPDSPGAILTQVDKDSKFYKISFASRQLKDHKKNYRKTTHLSFWKQQLQFGAWTSLTSISGESSSYCTHITNLWRS